MNTSQIRVNDWTIAYSSYVDTLHVYKKIYNQKPKEELISRNYGNFYLVVDRDMQVMLFEMKQASCNFGNIDLLDKKSIISKVTGYLERYVRQES